MQNTRVDSPTRTVVFEIRDDVPGMEAGDWCAADYHLPVFLRKIVYSKNRKILFGDDSFDRIYARHGDGSHIIILFIDM